MGDVREKTKVAVIELAESAEGHSTASIANMLGISRVTASRYLCEGVAEGKIWKAGVRGLGRRGVDFWGPVPGTPAHTRNVQQKTIRAFARAGLDASLDGTGADARVELDLDVKILSDGTLSLSLQTAAILARFLKDPR